MHGGVRDTRDQAKYIQYIWNSTWTWMLVWFFKASQPLCSKWTDPSSDGVNEEKTRCHNQAGLPGHLDENELLVLSKVIEPSIPPIQLISNNQLCFFYSILTCQFKIISLWPSIWFNSLRVVAKGSLHEKSEITLDIFQACASQLFQWRSRTHFLHYFVVAAFMDLSHS